MVKDFIPYFFDRGKKNVFIDWHFVEAGYGLPFWKFYQDEHGTRPWLSPYGLALVAARPEISSTPMLSDDPLGFIGAYSTLVFEGGRYRLWYVTYDFNEEGQEPDKLCYAESTDCRNWQRPVLGFVGYRGSKNNNILYGIGPKEKGGGLGAHGGTVFIDPSSAPSERYKFVHLGPSERGSTLFNWLYGAVSPDGLHWKSLPEPILKYTSDTQSVCRFDGESGQYVLYLRGWSPRNRFGSGGRRIIKCSRSRNFRKFPPPKPLIRPLARWGPSTDIYTNGYQPWPGADMAHVMLPALYHRDTDTLDVHLATSRDCRDWVFHDCGPIISDYENAEKVAMYAGVGIVPVREGKWGLPVFFSRRAHNEYVEERPALYLATLREDGFICLEASLRGEFYTYPCIFKGSRLALNSQSFPGGEIGVEILEVKPRLELTPFEGFTLDECDGVKALTVHVPAGVPQGSGVWQTVTWNGSFDVSKLSGKVVRLRFHLIRSRLYAFRFE
ncbi:MAG: hypothetical protein HQK89_03425 [Nitrospirae bacterium]|nr:hypothetical protein [Nitrospirota bacterium]